MGEKQRAKQAGEAGRQARGSRPRPKARKKAEIHAGKGADNPTRATPKPHHRLARTQAFNFNTVPFPGPPNAV